MSNLSLGAMNLFSCGGDRFAFLGFSLTKTAENSERTADVPAVPASAKTPPAEDFRRVVDVDG